MWNGRISSRRELAAITRTSLRLPPTSSTTVAASLIGLLVATVVMVTALGAPVSSSSLSLSRHQRAALNSQQMVACDTMCSDGDWCPLWCPEHTLFIHKRSERPFTDEDLSFDDYLFLKLMGRSRK